MTDNVVPFTSKTSPRNHQSGHDTSRVPAGVVNAQPPRTQHPVPFAGHVRLSPAKRMSIGANILQELELLHRDGAIDAATMNKLFHQIGHIAQGYSLTDPEPPLAS